MIGSTTCNLGCDCHKYSLEAIAAYSRIPALQKWAKPSSCTFCEVKGCNLIA